MPIDDDLRAAIEASGETRTEIARATGVDAGRLSRFIRKERGLSAEAIEAIAKHLGFDLILHPRKSRKRTQKGN